MIKSNAAVIIDKAKNEISENMINIDIVTVGIPENSFNKFWNGQHKIIAKNTEHKNDNNVILIILA